MPSLGTRTETHSWKHLELRIAVSAIFDTPLKAGITDMVHLDPQPPSKVVILGLDQLFEVIIETCNNRMVKPLYIDDVAMTGLRRLQQP